MKTKLDTAYLALLAALGLELACTSDPKSTDDSGTTMSTSTGSESESTTEGGSETATETGEPEPEPFECLNPQPILQDTQNPSGWEQCDNGTIHRIEAVTCDTRARDNQCDCGECDGTCMVTFDESDCVCLPGCTSDAECPGDNVCVCDGVIPGKPSHCVSAACAIDGDCGDGLCALSIGVGVCEAEYRIGCAGPFDCHNNDECEIGPCDNNSDMQYECVYANGHFECAAPGSCVGICGRPFLVDGEARVAPTRACADWAIVFDLDDLDSLDGETRARLARHWTRIGQFEHASVASFARFAAQLQQLGAPPRLLRDTHAAMADEVRHAQQAFGLASAYQGAPVGPGPFELRGSDSTTDLHAIVDGLIVEACIGETLSALEARELATHAEGATLPAVLAGIADDEFRHAQLGWRSLRWLLEQGGARLRAYAIARLEAALDELGAPASVEGDERGLLRFGVIDAELRLELQRAVIEQVLRPCVAALCEHGDGACIVSVV